MSQSSSLNTLEEFRHLFIRAISELQGNPAQALVVVAGARVVGYVVKNLLAPSYYGNIDGPPGASYISGHILNLFAPSGLLFHDNLQDTYGGVSRVKGMFGSDQLYISDPRALHEILVKEHESVFLHPQFIYDFNNVAFGPGIVSVAGAAHKAQRKMLNPVAKFYLIAQDLNDALIKDLGDATSKETDLLNWCNVTALELIGQAGLGHSFGLFNGVRSPYSVAVKQYLPTFCEIAPFRGIFNMMYRLPSAALRRKIVEYTPVASVQRMKNIIDIQDAQAQAILRQKKADLLDQTLEKPNDIMSVLLNANMEAPESERLPENQLLGQMNTLIFAGHETTSGALARVLHLLSQNQTIQSRLRAELSNISPTADYDELNALPYLDAVCREVLRIYPPGVILERQPNKDWVIPLRYPITGKDGSELRAIKVKKGTHIYLGVREANRCKETWGQDADEFRPERWLETLPSSVADAKTPGVYSSMMTFSAGPRACIGFKFSLLELKIVLSSLIRSFEFSPSTTPIEWRMTGAMAPYEVGAKEHGDKAKLPLCVTVVS
ncbi:cytochrome P450-dit2 [Ceratobasidium sp. UAMH 11750]|nr:cytochrome P450-dit2 [Ceratobasidium sp. UAMH 11750]